MPRRNSNFNAPEGPGWTIIFKSEEMDTATNDGKEAHGVLLCCAESSVAPLDYRIDHPADPAGEYATLEPGHCVPLKAAAAQGIRQISVRGSGGDATATIEVTEIR